MSALVERLGESLGELKYCDGPSEILKDRIIHDVELLVEQMGKFQKALAYFMLLGHDSQYFLPNEIVDWAKKKLKGVICAGIPLVWDAIRAEELSPE